LVVGTACALSVLVAGITHLDRANPIPFLLSALWLGVVSVRLGVREPLATPVRIPESDAAGHTAAESDAESHADHAEPERAEQERDRVGPVRCVMRQPARRVRGGAHDQPGQPKPRPITRRAEHGGAGSSHEYAERQQLSTNAAPPMSSKRRATSGVSVSLPRNSPPITAPDPSFDSDLVSPRSTPRPPANPRSLRARAARIQYATTTKERDEARSSIVYHRDGWSGPRITEVGHHLLTAPVRHLAAERGGRQSVANEDEQNERGTGTGTEAGRRWIFLS